MNLKKSLLKNFHLEKKNPKKNFLHLNSMYGIASTSTSNSFFSSLFYLPCWHPDEHPEAGEVGKECDDAKLHGVGYLHPCQLNWDLHPPGPTAATNDSRIIV